MTAARPPAWIAARDGIAHAVRGRDPRVVCGIRATDPRFAWPERFACPVCVRMVAAGDRLARKATR